MFQSQTCHCFHVITPFHAAEITLVSSQSSGRIRPTLTTRGPSRASGQHHVLSLLTVPGTSGAQQCHQGDVPWAWLWASYAPLSSAALRMPLLHSTGRDRKSLWDHGVDFSKGKKRQCMWGSGDRKVVERPIWPDSTEKTDFQVSSREQLFLVQWQMLSYLT